MSPIPAPQKFFDYPFHEQIERALKEARELLQDDSLDEWDIAEMSDSPFISGFERKYLVLPKCGIYIAFFTRNSVVPKD